MIREQFSKVIVALDVSSKDEAFEIVDQVSPLVDFFKVGLELYTAAGNDITSAIKEKGHKVFLDLKFHDIPNTVAKAVSSIARLSPDMITVHALGGQEMIKAAVEAAKAYDPSIKVLGVTVLTSMDEIALRHIGINVDFASLVKRLAFICKDNGLDGIICSAMDLVQIRPKFADPFLIITPGIRKKEDVTGDQKRAETPLRALENGADYLVVGRSVTAQKDPRQALEQLFY